MSDLCQVWEGCKLICVLDRYRRCSVPHRERNPDARYTILQYSAHSSKLQGAGYKLYTIDRYLDRRSHFQRKHPLRHRSEITYSFVWMTQRMIQMLLKRNLAFYRRTLSHSRCMTTHSITPLALINSSGQIRINQGTCRGESAERRERPQLVDRFHCTSSCLCSSNCDNRALQTQTVCYPFLVFCNIVDTSNFVGVSRARVGREALS